MSSSISGASRIRCGLVGCGAISDVHLASLIGNTAAHWTALFDVNRTRAEAAKARHGLTAEVVDSLDALAANVDAAIVAVPNVFHAEYSIKLLQAGIHVLCEKPLAVSLKDAEAMIGAATQAERVLACGLVRRFFGASELAAEALRRNLLGRPLRCEIRESLAGWYSSRANFDPKISGGGVLIDIAPHILDLLFHLLGTGELIEYRDDNRGGVEANTYLRLRCAGDSGLVDVDVHVSRGVDIKGLWRIVCENGTIEINPHERDAITLRYAGEPPFVTTAQRATGDPFMRQTDNFLRAIRGEERVRVPAIDALAAVAIIEQCYAKRAELPEPWTQVDDASPIRVTPQKGFQKILITGATGKVGSRLVEMYAAQNKLSMLRLMTRSYNSAERIMRFPVEVAEADLLDGEAVRKAIAGCDAVIHLGAGEKPGAETETILNAARASGVRRFVHMSSAAAFGLGLPQRIEEQQEHTPLVKTGELYADGKAAAEHAVMRAVRQGYKSVVMLRPHMVYGPAMRWSGELMQLLANDEICILEDGGWANLIYVDDLVEASVCALNSEVGDGAAFFVTDNEPVRWSEYIEAHARLIQAAPARVRRADVVNSEAGVAAWMRASFRPLVPVLRTSEFRSFVLKSPLMQATVFRTYLALRERPIVQQRMKLLRGGAATAGASSGEQRSGQWSEHWISLQLSEARLSGRRAAEQLGFRAGVNFAEGLRRSVGWFERHGLVRSASESLAVARNGD